MRLHFIGDVHGCIDELERLIQQLKLQPTDRLVFIGDLLDKGLGQIEVLDLVADLKRHYGCTLILGNHEFKYLKVLRQLNAGQMPRTPSYPAMQPTVEKILQQPHRQQLMQSAVLLASWKFHNSTFTAVHAGIAPHHHRLPDSDIDKLFHGRPSQSDILYCRYVRDGVMLQLGHERSGDKFWADVYDGRFGHVFFGHQPYPETIPEFTYATALDGGCVYGGKLIGHTIDYDPTTNLIIETTTQVRADRTYCQPHGMYHE